MKVRFSRPALAELSDPYSMFYRVIAGEIIVLRIVYGARNEPWAEL
jgi:hypothetical protein